jgi:Transcriptional regulatory protein, C terminal
MELTTRPKKQLVRFGVFELDPDAGELRKQGVRIQVQPKPLQMLEILLERPREIVTREELRHRLWGDTFASQLPRRENDLRPAPTPPARNHRAHSPQPPIPTHTAGPAHRSVLLQNLCQTAETQTRGHHATGSAHLIPSTLGFRSAGSRNPRLLSRGKTRRLKT